MSDHGERDLKAALREMAAVAERGLGGHPEPGELLDFVAGDLSAADRERIEEHLALCRDCARTALELAASPETEAVPAERLLAEGELAAEWERFRTALAPAPPARRAVRRSAAMSPAAWAIAASLLIAVIGLTVWTGRLRQEVRTLSEPQADIAVVDLVPVDAVARAEPEEELARLPGWADQLVLILNLADAGPWPEHRLEMADAEGRVVWSRSGVRRGPDGTFTLALPRASVPPGSYRIRISGRRGETVVPVAEYAVRFEKE